MIKKIIFGLLLGLMVILGSLSSDPWFLDRIEREFIAGFAKALDCRVSGRLERVGIWHPGFIMRDFKVIPRTGDGWYWSTPTFEISWNWWEFIKKRKLPLNIFFEDIHIHSQLDNEQLAIMPHLQTLAQEPAFFIPLHMNTISIAHAKLSCDDLTNGSHALCLLQCDANMQNKEPLVKTTLCGASCIYKGTPIISDLQGDVHFDGKKLRMNTKLCLPFLPPAACNCSINFGLENGSADLSAASADHAITITQASIDFRNTISIQATLGSNLGFLAGALLNEPHLSGDVVIDLNASSLTDNPQVRGVITIAQASYKTQPLAQKLVTNFSADMQQGSADLKIDALGAQCKGSASWHLGEQKYSMTLHNSSELSLIERSIINPEKFSVVLGLEKNVLNGSYELEMCDTNDQSSKVLSRALLTGAPERWHLQGKVNDYTYHAVGHAIPELVLETIECHDANGQLVAQGALDKKTFKAELALAPATALAGALGYTGIQSEGSLSIVGSYAGSSVEGLLTMSQATVRLPNTYNFITGLESQFRCDFATSRLELAEVTCQLHRGLIGCKRAVLMWDESSKIKSFYAPLLFDDCLLNSNKDLFTVVSGMVVCAQNNDQLPTIRGSLFLDKSQLKENIFSLAVQRQILANAGFSSHAPIFDAQCDLVIETKDPIRVKTPLVQTSARVKCKVANTIQNPSIAGSIKVNSGTISFPYKPLHITKGMLSFVPGKLTDPIIEFVAKNKIKQYNVTMQVMGSLEHPHIMLDSSPPLTQEQIMCLLLAGSEDSFTGAVPAVLMQNMKQIIFDTEHTPSKLHAAIAQLFSPLKHIYLIPSFSDQTSRGGLRGAIEIDIGERWRALIQKNFSLSEDTRFEIEYAISDDMCVRAFRDERQDVGAEVEFRWKF